jgi:hypothetical protein
LQRDGIRNKLLNHAPVIILPGSYSKYNGPEKSGGDLQRFFLKRPYLLIRYIQEAHLQAIKLKRLPMVLAGG